MKEKTTYIKGLLTPSFPSFPSLFHVTPPPAHHPRKHQHETPTHTPFERVPPGLLRSIWAAIAPYSQVVFYGSVMNDILWIRRDMSDFMRKSATAFFVCCCVCVLFRLLLSVDSTINDTHFF
jgi:hypothetical protein